MVCVGYELLACLFINWLKIFGDCVSIMFPATYNLHYIDRCTQLILS